MTDTEDRTVIFIIILLVLIVLFTFMYWRQNNRVSFIFLISSLVIFSVLLTLYSRYNRNKLNELASSDDLLNLQQRLDDLTDIVNQLGNDVNINQGDITTIQNNIATIQNNLTALQNDVSTNTADIIIIQNDITQLQADVLALQGQQLGVDVEDNGASVTTGSSTLNFTGSVTVTDGGSGQVNIDIPTPAGFSGSGNYAQWRRTGSNIGVGAVIGSWGYQASESSVGNTLSGSMSAAGEFSAPADGLYHVEFTGQTNGFLGMQIQIDYYKVQGSWIGAGTGGAWFSEAAHRTSSMVANDPKFVAMPIYLKAGDRIRVRNLGPFSFRPDTCILNIVKLTA